jgi:hypothetical protein
VDLVALFEPSGRSAPPAPPALAPGRNATAALTVLNAGNVAARGKVRVALMASADAVADAGDVTLRAVSVKLNVKPGARKLVRLRFRTPADLPPGAYLLLGAVDTDGALAESDKSNNAANAPLAVN